MATAFPCQESKLFKSSAFKFECFSEKVLVSLIMFIEFWKLDRIEYLGLKVTASFGSLEPL